MIRVTPLKALNVNTATAAELEELPGIGPALAERIVRYREEKGRLGSLQDLDAVKGLGEKKLEKIQPYVVF
jgi:competence protein ComEA